MFKEEGLCGGDLFEVGSDDDPQEKQTLGNTLFGEDAGEKESANSAISWQSFSRRSLLLMDDQNATNATVGGDQKRMKLSLDATSYAGPPATINCTPGFDVLESSLSSQGLLGSSCYVAESSSGTQKANEKCHNGGGVFFNCSLQDTIKNVGKEVVFSEAVASPASQESIATRLLLGNHPVVVAEHYELMGLNGLRNSKSDPKMDPRPFLQSHVMRLLSQAGWWIGKRKRPCRKYMEHFYRSPSGKSYREFTKVWKACGQIFAADKYDLVQVDDGREWAGINQFLSDLSDVLTTLENEMDHSDNMSTLVHRWLQLDPFVNVVFINKKIGSLRKEGSVRVIRTTFVEKGDKRETAVALERNYGFGSDAGQSFLLSFNGDPYTSIHEEPAFCGGNYQACDAQSGNRSFSEYGGLVTSSINCQTSLSVGTNDGITNQSCGMDEEKISFLEMMCLPISDFASGCAMSFGWQTEIATGDVDVNVHGVCQSVSPHQDSNLVDVNDQIDFSMNQEGHCVRYFTSGVPEQAVLSNAGEQSVHAPKFDVKNKKKVRRKSKKISEIRSATLYQDNDACDYQVESNKASLSHSENEIIEKSSIKSSINQDDKSLKMKKGHHTGEESKKGQKKKGRCLIEDDDLLVSAIFKNKDFGQGISRSACKKKSQKSKGRTKHKGRKGGCRLLLRNLGFLGKPHIDGTWWRVGARTVLSWLIDAGVISVNDVIQYRKPKDDTVVKDGLITGDGVLCRCCKMVLSVSSFKNHAGLKQSRQSLNLFMESGEPFSLCQLQAWSAEYKARKTGREIVKAEQEDQNDDSCGICGDGGELICCDNCPSTFHQTCLSKEDLPEGSWYCSNCTCRVCGDLVNAKEALDSAVGLKCSQCEHKYHLECMKGKKSREGVVLDTWFCSGSCQEVYTGLQSHVGICNHAADGHCWTLLRCIHEDQKVHSAQRLALKAECNSKLAVALTILEECFQPMVDSRTGISMIPQVIYNWGSEFARLDFHGFYTMVLEKDDILVAAASIRVHGVNVAEMPLIATCSKYRRQGMCRRLMAAIEEMLIFFKVEKLVISAIPDLVDTWKLGFGFTAVNDHEKESLNDINLMIFPGTIMLKKVLCVKEDSYLETGGNQAPLVEEGGACSFQENSEVLVTHQCDAKTDVECTGSHVPCESTACERTETNDIEKSEDDSAMERHQESKECGIHVDPIINTADKLLGACPPWEHFAVSTQEADPKSDADLLQSENHQDPKTTVEIEIVDSDKDGKTWFSPGNCCII